MRTFISVVLDRDERQVFAKAVPSIGVAFPGHPFGPSDERTRVMNSLGMLARVNESITYELAALGLQALEAMVEACEREKDRDYWAKISFPDPSREVLAQESGGLITDIDTFIGSLVQIREDQWKVAVAALALVKDILRVVTPKPVED